MGALMGHSLAWSSSLARSSSLSWGPRSHGALCLMEFSLAWSPLSHGAFPLFDVAGEEEADEYALDDDLTEAELDRHIASGGL